MVLQISFMLVYRIVLETSGANNLGIVELHWRDFAVFVSLSSRTNTRQGLALVRCIRRLRRCSRAGFLSFSRKSVRGWVLSWLEGALNKREVGSSSLPRPTTLIECGFSFQRCGLMADVKHSSSGTGP